MINLSPSILNAIDEFSRLPSIGRKTSQRIVFHLLKRPVEESEALATAIMKVVTQTRSCSICCNYCEEDICEVCSDTKRDHSRICVLEQASDVYPFEKMGFYNGLYHILGGALSPLDGITQEHIRIKELCDRMNENIQEVIIATNASSTGETTAMYLKKILSQYNVKVTRLARGIPMGSDLEFTDEVTLYRAFEDRTEI